MPLRSRLHRGNSSRAIIALLLGIGAWTILPLIAGIAAWILGASIEKDVLSGRGSRDELTMARIGKWLGIINVVLSVLGTCVVLMFFGGTAALIGLTGGR